MLDRANENVVTHGYYALQMAADDIDALLKLAPEPPETGGVIVSQPEIPILLQSMCVSMGLAWAALFDNGAAETRDWLRRAKAQRSEVVRTILGDLPIDALAARNVRNKMVHLEDHILRIDRRRPKAVWLSDMAITTRKLLDLGQDAVYSRVFIFDENILLHLEEEFDLVAYRDQARAALERLKSALRMQDGGPGGRIHGPAQP